MSAVTEYAEAVAGARIPAGLYVRLACKRHLDDLKRQGTSGFPYVINESLEKSIIDLAENLRYTDGEPGFVGTPVQLHGFAKFILGSIFGWVHKDTGYRRYRKTYIQVARKNIKSMLEAIIAIKMCGFDNYENAQVYCTATKMKQARVVWMQSAKFIRKEPELNELFKIREHDAEIECLLNGGKIMALGRDVGTIDGFDPHCGIVDEYHAHRTNQMVKLLEDGAVNQKESLIGVITTAGFNLNSPCFEEYQYCCNFLETGDFDDSYFTYIAQMDKEDDIWDSRNWIKCSPLVATLPQGIENITRFAAEARKKGGEDYRNLLTKTFNIWTQQSNNPLIKNYDDWKKCGSELTIHDMRGNACVAALDLSSGGDLTSLALEFPLVMDNIGKYYIYSHSFMPFKRLAEHIKTDINAQYDVWQKDGLLTLTETLGGVKTDYKFILAHLNKLLSDFDLTLTAIGYDPHNADAFLSDLDEFGVPCIEVKQSARALNTATDDFRLEVEAGNVLYDRKNKLLTWSIKNAVLTINSFGEIKVDKLSAKNRIDPVDAVIDAHYVFTSKGVYVPDAGKYAADDMLDKLWG